MAATIKVIWTSLILYCSVSFLELESLWSLNEKKKCNVIILQNFSFCVPWKKIRALKQHESKQNLGFNYQDEAGVVAVSPAEGWDTNLRIEVFMQYLTAMVSVATQN